MEHLLNARGLVKSYSMPGDDGAVVTALNGIDLDVDHGEFVAIMGPSGCGKSTLLHLLGGLDRPTSGQAILAGQRIDNLSEAARARLRRKQIGFVFQFFNLIGNLSVADNVELPALLAGASADQARRCRMELLDDLGLADKAQLSPARLSGGQQQRVALARALVNRPAVLLADEPTGNLDTASTREVLSLLRRFHLGGQTIVMVTHDARVASVSDRVVTMRDGRIADQTTLSKSSNPRQLLSQLIEMEV